MISAMKKSLKDLMMKSLKLQQQEEILLINRTVKEVVKKNSKIQMMKAGQSGNVTQLLFA